MNPASGSNAKSIAVIAFVSVLLFGIFYYLVTDATDTPSSNLKAGNQGVRSDLAKQAHLAQASEVEADPSRQAQGATGSATRENVAETNQREGESQVKGEKARTSVFGALSSQKSDVQAKVVLSGADAQTPESTVPNTGTDTIFGAFVVSSLIMFAGIYMLMTQPKDAALAKFEKRIIKELD